MHPQGLRSRTDELTALAQAELRMHQTARAEAEESMAKPTTRQEKVAAEYVKEKVDCKENVEAR